MSILFSHEGRLTTASLDTGRLDLPRDTRVFRSCLDHGRSVWTRSGQQPARSCLHRSNVGDWLGGERSGAERREPERSPDASALPPTEKEGRVGGLKSDVACDRAAIERRSIYCR